VEIGGLCWARMLSNHLEVSSRHPASTEGVTVSLWLGARTTVSWSLGTGRPDLGAAVLRVRERSVWLTPG